MYSSIIEGETRGLFLVDFQRYLSYLVRGNGPCQDIFCIMLKLEGYNSYDGAPYM